MKTVGQILAEERNRQNLSLDEVEAKTRIRKKILVALEKSDWQSLPSPTFVKGLIRNYGRFLNLDEKELLAFYRREYDEKKEPRRIVATNKVRASRFRLTPQLVTIGALAIFVTAIVGYLFFQYQSFTGPPLLEIEEPKDNIKVNALEVNLVGRTWEDAELKVNGERVTLSPGGTFSVSVGLTAGLNTVTITAANRFGKISTQKRTIISDVQDQARDINPQAKLSLVVKIEPNSANLLVEVDGQKGFEGVLVSGAQNTYTANERIRVVSQNAGSTKIIFQGVEEILGREGEAVEKVYTPG